MENEKARKEIILVDGDQITALLASTQLTNEGYHVQVVTKENLYDVLLKTANAILIIDFITSGVVPSSLVDFLTENQIKLNLVVLCSTTFPELDLITTVLVPKQLGLPKLLEELDKLPSLITLYDLSFLEETAGENKEFITKMMGIFKDNVIEKTSMLERRLIEKNYADIQSIAHQLKSSIDQLKIISIKQTVRTIETENWTESRHEELVALVTKLNLVLRQVANQF